MQASEKKGFKNPKDWSPETKQKVALTAAGIALAVGSVVAIVDYAERKRTDRRANACELIAGIAGTIGGILLATEPSRRKTRSLTMEDMFNEEELLLIQQQIRETLNTDTDHSAPSREHLHAIEVDSEATIEDFI